MPSVPYIDLTIGQLFILAGSFFTPKCRGLSVDTSPQMYSALVLFVAFYKFGSMDSDPVRFGHLAIAQLPAISLLAMKNSPLALVFGKGYEKLNFLHRFVGRVMVFFAVSVLEARESLMR